MVIQLGIDENSTGSQFSLLRNPTNGVFNFQWQNASKVSYTVSDILGKTIVSKKVNAYDNTEQLDLSNYSNGLYFMQVAIDDKVVTKKLLKNR